MTEMKKMKYEQPMLELVVLAANDILLTSGDENPEEETGYLNTFEGPISEIDWKKIWG